MQMGILDKFKKKEVVKIPLNPEMLKDKVTQGQQQEIGGLKGQLAEISAKEKEEAEEEFKENKELGLKKRLQEQEKEITKRKFNGSLSWVRFFYKLFNGKTARDIPFSKFGRDLEIVSFDFSESFGKFGDIVSLISGHLAILDNYGNIVCLGKELNHIIYRPSGLLRYMEMGKIPITRDSKMNIVIDEESVEIPKVIYDEQKKVYRLSTQASSLAISQIIKKDKELRDNKTKLDMVENTNIDLRKENSDLKRANKFIKAENETAKSDLSQALDSAMSFQQRGYELQKKVVEHTEFKAIAENLTNTYQALIKSLMEKIEETGDRTMFQQAQELYKKTSATVINQMNQLSSIVPKAEVKVVKEGVPVETKGGDEHE